MATTKVVKKTSEAAPAKKVSRVAAKPQKTPAVKTRGTRAAEIPARVKKQPVVGPLARTCPLVLDGEVDASEFSDKACLTCDEFDCKFCESQAGSGSLRSRLFAGTGDEDDDDEGEAVDPDADEGDESIEGDEGEDEEEF